MACERCSATLYVGLACFAAIIAGVTSQTTTCQVSVGGYSSYFGPKSATKGTFVDQTKMVALGRITKVVVYHNRTCIVGLRAQFGSDPNNTSQLGVSGGQYKNVTFALGTAEFINKIDVRNGTTCIELMTLHTTKGQKAAAGNTSSKAPAKTTAPSASDGFLLAFRGFEAPPAANKTKGPIQYLGFVWGKKECTTAGGGGAPVTVGGAPAPVPIPSPSGSPGSNSSSKPSSSPSSKPSSSPSSPAAVAMAKCPAVTAQCDVKAEAVEFNACSYTPPFTAASCWGGCCRSAGKCASSSCAISGLGRDVTSVICYGINAGISFGGSNVCNGLGCKLAVPGCITDTFGGNCIGKVVATGAAGSLDPVAAKYLGYPCLDATPSEYTLSSKGQAVEKGPYVAKLWTICDCMDQLATSMVDGAAGDLGANLRLPSTPGGTPDTQVPTPGQLLGGLFNKTNANKNDVLAAIAKLLPAAEKEQVDFDKLVPQLDLNNIFKLPEAPKLTIPEFNISLPANVFAGEQPDVSTLLNAFGGDKVSGLATLLKGMGGEQANSPLVALGDLLTAVTDKSADPWGALKTFMQTLPSDIATPTGMMNFISSLGTSSDGGASPLASIVDFIKTIPSQNSTEGGTGNRITDLVSNIPGSSGSENKLAGFLDLMSKVPSSNGSTGNPFEGLMNLISALPPAPQATDADALSQVGNLLSLLPKPDSSSDASVPANPLSGLSTLLSALPIQDASGNNPLGPLANLVGTVAEGLLSKVNGAPAEQAVSDPGSALANLFSALTSMGGSQDATATDVGPSSNPISSFLSGLAAKAPGNVNPLQSVLDSLPPPSTVTAADGGAALGSLVSGLLSSLSAAAPADGSSVNPLAAFLSGLASAAGGAGDSGSNPLAEIMGTVGKLVSGGAGGSEGGINPLVGGDGQQAAQSSHPLLSFLGGLVNGMPGSQK